MIALTQHPDRAAWLAARRGTIGASDIGAILRCSPHTSEFEAWAQITGRTPGTEESDAMALGTLLEPVVLGMYARILGKREPGAVVVPRHLAMVAHPAHPWARCSPDATTGPRTGCEAKTAGSRSPALRLWGTDDWTEVRRYSDAGATIPPHYALQVYWTLAVTGAEWWDLALLGPTIDRLRVWRIYADPHAQAQLLARIAAWHARHIVGDVAPDLDASTAAREHVSRQWAEAAGPDVTSRPATEEEIEAAMLYDAHRKIRDEADDTTKTLGSRIVELAAGAPRIWWDGGQVTLSRRGDKVSPLVKITV